MCELLIRVVDKINPDDAEKSARLLKRGDVVVVCPDGWEWSTIEQTNPDWRIVKIPGVAVDTVNDLIQSGDPTQANYKRRLRKLDVDFASLPQAVKNFITDDTRASPSITVSKAQIDAIVVVK